MTRTEIERLIERLQARHYDHQFSATGNPTLYGEATTALHKLLAENERLNELALSSFKAGCEWERKLNEEPAPSVPEVGNDAMGKSAGAPPGCDHCNEEISLQSVSGGGAKAGLYGEVTLKIGDDFVLDT